MRKAIKKVKGKPKKDMSKCLAAAIKANHEARLKRESMGVYRTCFMRLKVLDDAFQIVKDLNFADFRRFVSAAIRNAKKEMG